MFSVKQSGNFDNFENFAKRTREQRMYDAVQVIAREGVAVLAANTPSLTGLTASSWGYEVDISRGRCTITWTNSNIQGGFPVAIGLQYGHGTGTGGWVEGVDYINPAMQPIFEAMLADVWTKVVTS